MADRFSKPNIILISLLILLLFIILAILTAEEPEGLKPVAPLPEKCLTVYLDSDGDGYGELGSTQKVCEGEDIPIGYAIRSGDCNDRNVSIWNGITVYRDQDEDGYSTDEAGDTCTNNQPPKGWIAEKSTVLDCDDRHDLVYPGSEHTETAGGLDHNCNGMQDLPIGTFFVTSNRYYGDLGGLEGADDECQKVADNTSTSGKWVAFLSTSYMDAIDRPPSTNYVNAKGIPIASGRDDLTKGWIDTEIQFTETGSRSYDDVWTGSGINGRFLSALTAQTATCDDWTKSNYETGIIGTTRAANSHWIYRNDVYCNKLQALYCVRIS